MPIYQYQSDAGDIVEIFRSMKGKIPEKITRKKIQYKRVWTTPSVIIDSKNPKTIGGIAEANTKRMVKEGKIKAKPKPKKPWWRDSDKPNMNLANLSKKQRESYIRTGKTK